MILESASTPTRISNTEERKRHHERTAFGRCPAESDVHDQVAQIE